MINETSTILNKYIPISPKTSEIKILLNQLITDKNNNEQILEILRQINSILHNNREESDNNIEQLTKFIENNYENLTVKIILKIFTFLSKLLSHNSSLQIIFCRHFYKTLIYIISEKENTDEENNYIIKNIGNIIQMCGSHLSNNIKADIDKIGNNCLNNDILIQKKVIYLKILIEFILSSPMVSFNKMMKMQNFLIKLILIYYKDNYIEMRRTISDLSFYFFSLMENRENNMKENYFKIIYELIIKNFKNQNLRNIKNDSDIFIIHGSILLIKSIIIMKEFFSEKSNEILEILFRLKDSKYLPIKNKIIEYIPDLTDYLINNIKLLEKFCDFLIDEYISNKDNTTNTLILSSLEKLSTKIPKDFFEFRADKIILCLKKKFEDKNYKIKIDEVECLSELLTNYYDSILSKISLNTIFDKIFECGFNQVHVNFLQKLINIYLELDKDKNIRAEEEIITVILVSLNVISLILSQKINLYHSFDNISKNIKLSNNKSSKKHFKNIFKLSRKQIGNVLIEYLKKEQKNKSTFEDIKLQMGRSSINFLKKINHPYFAKDILLFYQRSCFPLLKEKIKSIEKIDIISLITSNWIYYNIKDDEIKSVIENIIDKLLDYYLRIKNENIKKSILDNLDERYDLLLSKENFLRKLFLLFDCSENHLKVGIVMILGRLKKYSPVMISMILKKEIMRIYSVLNFSTDIFDKEKAISLLSYYIIYTKDIVLEYFDKNIFEVLIKEINKKETFYDSESNSLSDVQEKVYNDDVNLKIPSILTELISNSCNLGNEENEELYYRDIIKACIDNLKENTNNISQEILLKTILTVFEHSVKTWDVYNDYPEFVFTLIKILKFSNSKETRVYALKIFGYIGSMDPNKLDFFLTLKKNALDNDDIENSEDKNFQIFDKNKKIKKNDKKNVFNVLNHMNEFSNKINYEGFISKKQYNQDELLNAAILSLMTILNDDNKKEHIKIVLKILLKIIKYLKKESDNKEKDEKDSKLKPFENESIELILNSFVKDSSKNINKEYKMRIIYKITVYFKKNVEEYFTDLINLVIDNIKNQELLNISLSILIELLRIDTKSLDNYYHKLIPTLIDLLNDRTQKIGSILSEEDSIFINVIECFSIMSDKISDYLNIILDEIFDLLNLSIINIQKYNLNKDSDEFELDIKVKNNNNIQNLQMMGMERLKTQHLILNNIDSNKKSITNLDEINKDNNSLLYSNDDNLGYNNNYILNSPLNDAKLRSKLRKNSAIPSTSSAKKKYSYSVSNNTFNNKILKKILEFIKKIIFLDTFQEYLPKLMIILNKYICFCPESRNEIIEFIFELLFKKKPNERNCYLPYLLKLINEYKIPIIKNKIYINIMENSFENEKDKLNIEQKKESSSIGDNSLINKYKLNKSFESDEDKIDTDKNLENILDDFNPKNYSLKDDWNEWFLSSAKQLFNNSPNQILRYCSKISDSLTDLYKYAFYEVWKIFSKAQKIEMISYLTVVLSKETLPNDIRLIILNLVEYVEREQNFIEYFDTLDLANAAKKCKADAKELYYLESYYRLTNDKNSLKRLMDLYYELDLPESVVGISEIEKNNPIFKNDNWFLKLRQWDSALKVIKEKRKNEPPYNVDLIMDNFQCLEGLSDWDNLLLLNDEIQKKKNDIFIKESDNIKYNKINYYAAESALYLNKWDKLEVCISQMNPINDEEKFEKKLFETILSINNGELEKAKEYIKEARISILDKIKILLTESYERAYKLFLSNDHLYQLEEIIQLKEYQISENMIDKNIKEKKGFILNKDNLKNRWDQRMKIISEDSTAYEKILAIRNLVFTYEEDYQNHLDLAKICREDDDFKKSMNILERLKQKTKKNHISLAVTLNISKCLNENFIFTDNIKARKELEKIIKDQFEFNTNEEVSRKLMSKIYCYYSFLLMNEYDTPEKMDKLDENIIKEIQYYATKSTKMNENSFKAWHNFGLINYKYFESFPNINRNSYAKNAIEGFTHSVNIGGKSISKILQDLIRFIGIWFQIEDNNHELIAVVKSCINQICSDYWILVLPQLLARININKQNIRNILINLLIRLGKEHPCAIIFQLIVIEQSSISPRSNSAKKILKEMPDKLINACTNIVKELNRIALLLFEEWANVIEESAEMFYEQNDINGMLNKLIQFHEKMKKNPATMNELNFFHLYKGDLNTALQSLLDYKKYNDLFYIKEAWDIYQELFLNMRENGIKNNYSLSDVSPILEKFKESEASMLGIYKSDSPIIKISGFKNTIEVLRSKQRPKKITIYGSDSKEYNYLLKANEDLRQDERAMQLFGLINSLLCLDADTVDKFLLINRYPILALSNNTGVIGWLSGCDTLSSLIKEYREANKIPKNLENNMVFSKHKCYESATMLTKLSIFKEVIDSTAGLDLNKILWKKSKNSEDWVDRRTNYSRSLSVVSMAGYILGLGDRHPSNIMMEQKSGKIFHIDFGDCFEVAQKRRKFPEKVPFRLTRMLIQALEISGIEGIFRITCENVMRVLRNNKDSLVGILTTFIHDPLVSFRSFIPLIRKERENKAIDLKDFDFEKYFLKNNDNKNNNMTKSILNKNANLFESVNYRNTNNQQYSLYTFRKLRENNNKLINQIFDYQKKSKYVIHKMDITDRQLYNEFKQREEIESKEVNDIAKILFERILDKLNGYDFNKSILSKPLNVQQQVDVLISKATNEENICQSYIGWCPFW